MAARKGARRLDNSEVFQVYQWFEKNKDRMAKMRLGFVGTAKVASDELKLAVSDKTVQKAAAHFGVDIQPVPVIVHTPEPPAAHAQPGALNYGLRLVNAERSAARAEQSVATLAERFAKLEEAVLEIQTRPVPTDPTGPLNSLSAQTAELRKGLGELKDAVIPLLAKLSGMDKLQAEVARLASEVGQLKLNRAVGDAVNRASVPPKNS